MEIYKSIHILKNFPLDIECISAYDDYLLVGSKQGTLLHYSTVLQNTKDLGFDVKLLKSNKNFAKKPITQIAAIPQYNIVISLSDGLINILNLEDISQPSKCTIEKAKGTFFFIIDLQKIKTITNQYQYALRLGAVIKKKIMLFYWKNDTFYSFNGTDIILNDTPKMVSWCRESLVIGFKNEYCRIPIGGKIQELFSVGQKYPEPFVDCLSENRLILGKDENTYFFDENGKPILNYPLTWSSNLIKIVDDLIYIIGLLPNSTVEVKTIEPKMQFQTIRFQNKNSKLKQLIKCLNKNGLLYLCSPTDVYALVILNYKKQISQLIKSKNFNIALNLANIYLNEFNSNSNKIDSKQIEHIKYLQAFDYFCNKQFEEAIKIYYNLKIDPSFVIGLYPDLLPEEFRCKLEYPLKLPELKGNDLDNAIAVLTEYLTEVRNQLQKCDVKQIQFSGLKNFSGDNENSSISLSNNIEKLKQIVETSLLKCYLQTNDALVASLLRLPTNHCHLEETEKVLKHYNKYNELIILYKSRNLHRKALQLLNKVNMQSKGLHDEIKINDAHIRTKEYLQHLGKDHLDLIFEYSEWVLRQYPEDGLKIFTEDFPEIESLPRKEVLEYLRRIDNNFLIPYLETIIYEWNETDHILHDTLANEYREKIRTLIEAYKNDLKIKNEKPAKAGEEPGQLGILRKKLQKFLYYSKHYTAEKLAFFFLNDDLWEERAIVLSKIGNHHEALAIYVYILNDNEKAEKYCETIFNNGLPGSQDVFFILLKLYLFPCPINDFGNKDVKTVQNKDINYALNLLQNHAIKIDPLLVLNELPDDTPIASINFFLSNVFKHLISKKNNTQIYSNLLLLQYLMVQKQKINLHLKNKVIIDEHSLCQHCKKKIGKSAFLRFPNKDLIHYSCKDGYEESFLNID